MDMHPSPIRPSWILDGTPIARNNLLSTSADGTANTYIWDCTAGRFNWFYDVDETVYVIEGGVVIRDSTGVLRSLRAGDTMFFPAGARAEWHVQSYIRKIAFCRVPLPRFVLIARQSYRFLKRLTGSGRRQDAAPAMFQSS
ncbi:MAG TPA: cupin domain-containing protein [Steroidobacteraceae bacterium]